MRYKTGIHDEEIIRDTVQDFYVKLLETKALESFDEDRVIYGTKEAVFNNFVCTQFCWMLTTQGKKNSRINHDAISTVKIKTKMDTREVDVWEFTSREQGWFTPHQQYQAAHVYQDQENTLDFEFQQFIAFIRRTEPARRAERMILFLEKRTLGCKSVDVAYMLGVSNNMVKIIKKSVQRKYRKWQADNRYDF